MQGTGWLLLLDMARGTWQVLLLSARSLLVAVAAPRVHLKADGRVRQAMLLLPGSTSRAGLRACKHRTNSSSSSRMHTGLMMQA
jgi:hypothetical protein